MTAASSTTANWSPSNRSPMDVGPFQAQMRCRGWVRFNGLLDQALNDRLNDGLISAYEEIRRIQVSNGLGDSTDGSLHHLLGLDDSFMDLLNRMYVDDLMRQFLGGPYVLNSYGGVINKKDVGTYLHNVHRDVRSYTEDINLMINMLIMLDDFTIENGATYLLSGSHFLPQRPTDDYFFANAERVLGPRGTIILFDSRIWHAAGKNQTDQQRRALTLTFTKPFMKPQLDYCRALGNETVEQLSPEVRQLVGYNARIPTNLDEWYCPPTERLYKTDQG